MTILETIPIFEQPGNYNNLTMISLLIAIICAITACIIDSEGYEIGAIFFISISVISAIVFLIGLILTITEPMADTGRKQYIIRVNENTPINEIYDKYKIIDHTKYTDVYTVEELEDD